MKDALPDVRVTIPARAELVRVARLAATGTASTLGFDVEELDDLSMAVDEGCVALIEAAADTSAELRLRYQATEIGLVVTGSCIGAPVEVHDIAASILERTTDRYAFEREGADNRFRFSKLLGDVG